jgi:long-chain acyl-CoA synthetase
MADMRTIWSLWQEAVDANRTNPAYLVEEEGAWGEVSWAEADRIVQEFANGLLAIGLRKGDAFGILARNGIEWALFDFALAHIGVVAAPVYPSSTPADSAYVLEHAHAVGCLVDTELRDKIAGIELEHVIERERLDELRALGREHAAQNPDAVTRTRAEIGDDDLYTLIYTSGTTGPSKGCMILNRNYYDMVGTIDSIEAFFLPTDVMLLYLPLTHNFGRLMHLLGAHMGYTIAFLADPRRIGEVMPQVRPTVFPTVPRVLEKVHTAVSANFASATGLKRRLADWALGVGTEVSERRQRREPIPRGLAFKHRLADRLVFSKVKARLGGRLRAAISGGAPLAKEIAEFFHALDILILEGYGQTEETSAATVNRPTHYKFGTVGPAIPGIDLKLAEDGEILIAGPTVFAGYLDDEAATRAVLPGDGWLHTGDVGTLDEDGFLTVTDRKKDLIVTAGGKNVSPQNLENLLKTVPVVSQALVVGDRRPYLVALITLDEEEVDKLGAPDDARTLVEQAVERINEGLASFEQIRRYTILPRDFSAEQNEVTPTLKLKRRVCEEHFAAELEELYR